MELQHFILTRFNVASGGREAQIRSRRGWLERRFELFETYCLPSVASQSNREFSWLIYFDQSTDGEFRRRIETLRTQFPFESLFVEEFDASFAKLDVAARLNAGAQKILTTRLDNDDAIARDFVKNVQNAAAQNASETLLSFPSGYSLKNGRLYQAHSLANPFISLLEYSSDPRTVWFDEHQNLAKHLPILPLESRAWIQVIHEDNVSNRVRGRLVDSSHPLPNFFPILPRGINPPKRYQTLLDSLIIYPLRQWREALIWLAKRLRVRRPRQ